MRSARPGRVKTRYEVVQNPFSLLRPDDERAVRSLCAERGVAFTPYSPLAGGALTGKYQRGAAFPAGSRLALRPDGVDEMLTPAAYGSIDRLRGAAEDRHGVECGALALACLLHHPDVSAAVVGPSRHAPHLGLAVQARNVVLSQSEFGEIASWFRPAGAT